MTKVLGIKSISIEFKSHNVYRDPAEGLCLAVGETHRVKTEDGIMKISSKVAKLQKKFQNFCIQASVKSEKYTPAVVCLLVTGIVVLGMNDSASAQVAGDAKYRDACNRLLGLMEGSFGALVTVAAGVGAIIASAVGGFKMAWTLVVVAVGAFILRAYVTLFFAGCGL